MKTRPARAIALILFLLKASHLVARGGTKRGGVEDLRAGYAKCIVPAGFRLRMAPEFVELPVMVKSCPEAVDEESSMVSDLRCQPLHITVFHVCLARFCSWHIAVLWGVFGVKR
jgi:hypothetical protein